MMKRNSAETIKTCIVIFENIKNLGSGDLHNQFAPLLISELKTKEQQRKDIALKLKHLNYIDRIFLIFRIY